MSIAGGVDRAIERGKSVEVEAIQIFTKNSNQWNAKPLGAKEIDVFKLEREAAGIRFAVAHDSYLINLASPKPELQGRSLHAFQDEMDRAEQLGLEYLIFHPGAHIGDGIETGCKRVAEAMNRALEKKKDHNLVLLIENAAGQGTTLGREFDELALIRDQVEDKKRVGFCLDTCHAFAAGYDLRTEETYEKTMKTFDRVAGVKNIKAFHLNDSKKGLDSRVDRHQHIGEGEIGKKAFGYLLNDSRFKDRPMVLETPKSEDLHEDRENLAILGKLRKSA